MNPGRFTRAAVFASAMCCATLTLAARSQAVSFSEFVDPNPAPGNQFGNTIAPLSTGNVVITSPRDGAGGTDAGAVYLFNGATGALISTLRGSTGDQIGYDVTALTNGNYVIRNLFWQNSRGAATWGNGTTGVSGVVSAANSLVGSTTSDQVGSYGVLALSNGNYVVLTPGWNTAIFADVGAVTWGNGASGVSGVISAGNSLVGSAENDQVGGAVTVLTNGNYVVASGGWDNVAIPDAGAVTWCSGTTGVSGTISSANSLVGSKTSDFVGNGGVTALSNGNYVALSPNWDNGAIAEAGAVTWGSGTTGVTGVVSAANSLVGSKFADQLGISGVKALANGNYVVSSTNWDNGAIVDAGAATWASGTTGLSGAVSAANSLVGSKASDFVGSGGVTALTNGNYVVCSSGWDNGAIVNAGAATWGSGTTGVNGAVSAANSLVGSAADNNVGVAATALVNGNYVVRSPLWDNGGIANVGAVTWGSGTAGVSGVLSSANSLVGSTTSDLVGNHAIAPLSNGNYVVRSSQWDNGAIANAGAATWGNGTTGVTGVVSAANSLVGSTGNDFVSSYDVTALTNGNYVVLSGEWHNGAIVNAGAATWGSGTAGVVGAVSAANSLVGSTVNDLVGNTGVTALSNGNYVVSSGYWSNGAVANVGAATWCNGTIGTAGVVSTANSLVGSTAQDYVGTVTALSNGNYVVARPAWDNAALTDAGAATWGSGETGFVGTVGAANSLVGTSANTGLNLIIEDHVNKTFFGQFVTEGGGRVRVGAASNEPSIVSALDIPNDQGGWLRLTFVRSPSDAASVSPPVAMYGVWRHVPGTVAQDAGTLRADLMSGLNVQEMNGRIFVTGPGSPGAGINSSFPPGTWESVANVSAVQQAQYVVAVPTISNAAPNDFVVTAHTTIPSLWFISTPVSGQSVDNLAPAQPAQFIAPYSGGQTNLQWAANTENDLGSYHLHRGASAGFTPSIANRIAVQIATSYADVGPAGSFYKLSALDVNGNESSFALATSGTTGVDDAIPVAFALEGARPNPASRNRLDVAFALPTGATARLDLMDVSGRRVLSREVGSMGAGRHTVSLSAGRAVAAGLYWVRLTQGANQQRMRVAVIE